MKIGIMDFSCHKTHAGFNTAIIQYLLHNHTIVAITDGQNYQIDKINAGGGISNINFIYTHVRSFPPKSMKLRLETVRAQKRQWQLLKNTNINDFQALIILNFSAPLFAFAKKIYRSGIPIYMLIHNVDLLKKKKFLHFFRNEVLINKYKDLVNFIVLDPFEKEILKEQNEISENRIFVVPWLVIPSCSCSCHQQNTEPLFIALAHSNDEEQVQRIINNEKTSAFFLKNKIHFIIKSKSHQYDNGFLKVYNTFLKQEEYQNLYEQATAVITLFPSDFGVRVSGTTIDAIVRKKFVIGSRIPIIQEYARRYPKCCITYKDIPDLLKLIKERTYLQSNDEDFVDFIKDHGISAFTESMDQIINDAAMQNGYCI